MILKQKKKYILSIYVPIILLLLIFINLNGFQFNTFKYNIAQYLMTTDPGFSSRRNIVGNLKSIGDKNDLQYRLFVMASFIKSIPKIAHYKLFGKKFDRIDIDIKHLDYEKIMLDRKKALEQQLLVEPSDVNAKIRFNGDFYNASIRLKGDLIGHWSSQFRMSLRVRLKGGDTILGYSNFSIQKQVEREYPYDDIFQKLIRATGNLAPRHEYVHVFVNGVNWGIMDMEEHMSNIFLENQQRKESAILRFSDERHWLYKNQSTEPHPYYRLSDPSLYIRLYMDKKYLKDIHYRKIISYVSNHQKKFNSLLYDVNSFTNGLILASAWGDLHTLRYNNTRYYFNPYTLKLELITTDQTRAYDNLENLLTIVGEEALFDPFISISKTKEYATDLNSNIDIVRNALSSLEHHANKANLLFPVDKKINTDVIIDNMSTIIANKHKYLINSPNYNVNRQFEFPSVQQSSEFLDHVYVRHFIDGRLELYNLIPDDVVVSDILYNGDSFLDKALTVPSYLDNSSPTLVNTNLIGVKDFSIDVVSKYKGHKRISKNGISLLSGVIRNPLLYATKENSKGLIKTDLKKFEFKKGEWLIEKPIVIEGDLHIPAGTKLKFSKNSYLIIKGSLIAIGSEDLPIIFEPIYESWKGLYVLEADNQSFLDYVSFYNTRALEDDILKLTGGITFYKADVIIKNTTINGAIAEDAINIVESTYEMQSVLIDDSFSDGLDSDFSNGKIKESIFSNIGGDATDFSGSIVDIINIEVSNVKDKAASVGEKSNVSISNSKFYDVGVGVVSKDGSRVVVSNTKIYDYKLYAAMSYMKKNYYSKPQLHLLDCEIDNESRAYIRQSGTMMTVNDYQIQEFNLNVDALYNTDIMRK